VIGQRLDPMSDHDQPIFRSDRAETDRNPPQPVLKPLS
jgi:hypothetical protein